MVLVKSGNNYKGFAAVGNRRYFFEISSDDNFNTSSLYVDWRLKKLLGPLLNEFLHKHFSDVYHFYNQFVEFLNLNIKAKAEHNQWLDDPLKTCALIKTLEKDFKVVGENIKNIDIENQTVSIEIIDAQFRSHKAVIKLNIGLSAEPITIIFLDLPLEKLNENFNNFDNINNVTDFVNRFSFLITSFQDFWNTVSVIDSQCCILDPPNPTFKDIFRRIKLKDNLSIGINVNPLYPKQLPLMKFFGCQSEVDYYQEILQNNLLRDMWDVTEDLMYNISNVLDISIPNKMFIEDADLFEMTQEKECAICFTPRLKNELPNEMCESLLCNSVYHTMCLFTYFSSIPGNREYFGKMQGECPKCKNVMYCSVFIS